MGIDEIQDRLIILWDFVSYALEYRSRKKALVFKRPLRLGVVILGIAYNPTIKIGNVSKLVFGSCYQGKCLDHILIRIMYSTNTLSNGLPSPSGGVGTVTGMGTTGNVVTPANQVNTPSTQSNLHNNPNAVGSTNFYRISDDQLYRITEDLFAKSPNISKYIKLNLQNHSAYSNLTGKAKELLFHIESELLEYSTISVTQSLEAKFPNG